MKFKLPASWTDRERYSPFFLLFNLSAIERIVHGLIIFVMGALVVSYKKAYIYQDVINNRPTDHISNWLILPFVFMTFWMVKPMLEISVYRRKMNDRHRNGAKFPVGWFIVEIIWEIILLQIFSLVYIILLLTFMANIWN